jgi:hypothetical protein
MSGHDEQCQRTEVSIHVTIIYRHSLLDVDGESSTPDDPNIVCEHFYVISPHLMGRFRGCFQRNSSLVLNILSPEKIQQYFQHNVCSCIGFDKIHAKL